MVRRAEIAMIVTRLIDDTCLCIQRVQTVSREASSKRLRIFFGGLLDFFIFFPIQRLDYGRETCRNDLESDFGR